MLTLRQKEVLDLVQNSINKKGVAPTHLEIAKYLKVSSVATVHEHLQALENKGYLTRRHGQARGMSPSRMQSGLIGIPLLGMIAAGGPIEAIRNPESVEVPRNMLGSGARYYALKVTGTSMIEEGISDGDIVVIREQSTIGDGEKAVAYLPDKNAVTLKKIYREGHRIKLVPANKTMKPFYETNVEIQGKVVGVIREEI